MKYTPEQMIVKSAATIFILMIYLGYLKIVKKPKEVNNLWSFLGNNFPDIIFLSVLVPRIAEHLSEIFSKVS